MVSICLAELIWICPWQWEGVHLVRWMVSGAHQSQFTAFCDSSRRGSLSSSRASSYLSSRSARPSAILIIS